MEENKLNINEMSDIETDEIDLISIKRLGTDKIKFFYVGPYQRGYRWSEDEIESLLDDIITNDADIYCLQPLVICKRDEFNDFELIDGQQRMTTVFLILSVLKWHFKKLSSELPFHMKYDTRDTSSEFLKKIEENEITLLHNLGYNEESVSDLWQNLISEHPKLNNIDNYHFFHAYITIFNWMNKVDVDVNEFFKKFWNKTYVIWYPVQRNEIKSIENIFLNLNSGKIRLTSAELIKALFILDIDNKKNEQSWKTRTEMKNKLAQEWDEIERRLHKDDFWNFIQNSNKSEYATRIGMLFDIICKKNKNSSDYFSYLKYSKKEEPLDWEKVKEYYNNLEEWYNDIFIYHRIGFMINSNSPKEFNDFVNLSKGKTKKEFKNALESEIKKYLKKRRTLDGINDFSFKLDNLSYKEDKHDCQDILLLYNILTLENMFPGYRFPFDLYQDQLNRWTIEHIHPQNPQELKNVSEAVEWLDEFIGSLEEIEGEEGILSQKIKKLKNEIIQLAEEEPDKKIPNKLSEDINETTNEMDDFLHGLGNLALLDSSTNSSISNKSFLKKRELLIKIYENNKRDKNKVYIPLCTINSFLKTTSINREPSMKYWTYDDYDDYMENIRKTLENYLPTEGVSNEQ